MEQTSLKCHKCKSLDLIITELWSDSSIVWEQTGGYIDKKDGMLNEGNPYRLECKCKNCKHRWKIKKHWQIDHVLL